MNFDEQLRKTIVDSKIEQQRSFGLSGLTVAPVALYSYQLGYWPSLEMLQIFLSACRRSLWYEFKWHFAVSTNIVIFDKTE